MPFNTKKMRLIRQKSGSDCAICCMTMLTGLPYRKVLKLVGDTYHPDKGMGDSETALMRLGFREKRVPIKGLSGAYHVEPVDFKKLYRGYTLSPEYFREQIWGRRALLSVPALNIEDGRHMVYWHYDRLYDPSTKKTYKQFKDLKPETIILFMEKPA